MGADYSQCASCETSYHDDSDYCVFCDCGCNFCTKRCGKLDNYFSYSDLEKENASDDDPRYEELNKGHNAIDKSKPITCVICRKEQSNNYVLLQYLLKITNLTREQATEKWRQDPEE